MPLDDADVREILRLIDSSGVDELRLETADGTVPAGSGRGLLFGQDASFPDLERWTQWSYTGRREGALFHVEEAPERAGLGPTPGLVQRWRRQRELERACRRAIPGT